MPEEIARRVCGAIMKITVMMLLVSSLLVLSAPVRADEGQKQTIDGTKHMAPSGTPRQEIEKQTRSDLNHIGAFIRQAPLRAPGFSAGVLVGTPIAILRQCSGNVLNATRGQWESNKNPILLVPALCLGVPGGVLSGFLDGVWVGPANAWVNADKPFSKESFSLGEMIYDPTDL